MRSAQPPLISTDRRTRLALAIVVGVAVLVSGGAAVAGDGGPGSEPDEAYTAYLLTAPRLLGELGGRRAALADVGVVPSLFYNHVLGIQATGGRNDDARARGSGTADFFLHVVFDRLLPWQGTAALLQVKSGHGENVNPSVGALSDPFDDADGDIPAYVPQLWVQQSFGRGMVQVRVGYLDHQVVLDRNAYANSEDLQFMSTFLDNDNATIPLPLALGASVFLSPTDWLDVIVATADAEAPTRSAGFDTAFDGFTSLFGFLEMALRPTLPSPGGSLPGTYRLGLLWDPRSKERLDREAAGRRESGDAGFYLSCDQMLYRERPDHPQGLGAFLRYGHRDPTVNRISHFWSVGVQYHGLSSWRADDVLGFGLYQARISSDVRATVDSDLVRETGLEWYYRVQVLPWLTVTPDLQLVMMPGARRSVDDAVILGLRSRVTF